MNLVDAYVTKIDGPPKNLWNAWFVPVEYDSEGRPGKTDLMFKTEKEAKELKIGHIFQT